MGLKSKICSTCKELLHLNMFSPNKKNKDGLNYVCRVCKRKKYKENLKLNQKILIERECTMCKQTLAANRFHKNRGKMSGLSEQCKDCRNTKIVEKRYNLKSGELINMKKKQDYKCAICLNESKILAVDHCHSTGKIRGLLCSNCNNGLGRFKDNIKFLKKAIKYLEENDE